MFGQTKHEAMTFQLCINKEFNWSTSDLLAIKLCNFNDFTGLDDQRRRIMLTQKSAVSHALSRFTEDFFVIGERSCAVRAGG